MLLYTLGWNSPPFRHEQEQYSCRFYWRDVLQQQRGEIRKQKMTTTSPGFYIYRDASMFIQPSSSTSAAPVMYTRSYTLLLLPGGGSIASRSVFQQPKNTGSLFAVWICSARQSRRITPSGPIKFREFRIHQRGLLLSIGIDSFQEHCTKFKRISNSFIEWRFHEQSAGFTGVTATAGIIQTVRGGRCIKTIWRFSSWCSPSCWQWTAPSAVYST